MTYSVSGAHQGDSAVYTHMLFLKLFFIICYYKKLNIFLCAIQKPLLLVAYIFFNEKSSIIFTLSQTSEIKMSNFLIRQKFISFLKKHIYYTYLYISILKLFYYC